MTTSRSRHSPRWLLLAMYMPRGRWLTAREALNHVPEAWPADGRADYAYKAFRRMWRDGIVERARDARHRGRWVYRKQ